MHHSTIVRLLAAATLFGGACIEDVDTSIEGLSFTLTATKHYDAPAEDGERSFDSAHTVELPPELPVTVGNAGNHRAYLFFRTAGGTQVRCTYKGGSAQSHPRGERQLTLGQQYLFQSCEDGSVAGDEVDVVWLKLRVDNGDSWKPTREDPQTTITWTFAAAPVADACAMVVREGARMTFPASEATREALGVARWQYNPLGASREALGAIYGFDGDGRALFFAAGTYQPELANALGPEASPDEVAAALPMHAGRVGEGEGALEGLEEDAVLAAFFADLPSSCLYGSVAAAPPAADDVGSTSAALEMEGDRWTCKAEHDAAFDGGLLAMRDIFLATRGGSTDITDALERIAGLGEELRDLNCCLGITDEVLSRGEMCGCEARTGGERPVLQYDTTTADLTLDIRERRVLCEACPSVRPKWDGADCQPCATNTDWNAGTRQCEEREPRDCVDPPDDGPLHPDQGIDPSTITTWTPNPTANGNNECYFAVTADVRYRVPVRGDDGWSCEVRTTRAQMITQGPIHGIGTYTIESENSAWDGSPARYVSTGPDPRPRLEGLDPVPGIDYGPGPSGFGSATPRGYVDCNGEHLSGDPWPPPNAEVDLVDWEIVSVENYREPLFGVPDSLTVDCGDGGPGDRGDYDPRDDCSEDEPPEPECKPSETLTSDNYCVCNADGPPRNDLGECACEIGQVEDPTTGLCTQPSKCFGAQGAECTPIQSEVFREVYNGCPSNTRGPAPVDEATGLPTCVNDAHYFDIGNGEQYQTVSRGSLLHDDCCRENPEGFICGGNGTQPQVCFNEFMVAIHDAVTDGHGWRGLFDRESNIGAAIFEGGNPEAELSTYGKQLRAPYGILMDPEDARFCDSGEVEVAENGESVCAGDPDELPAGTAQPASDPPIPPPTFSPGEGEPEGTCELFTGAWEELQFFVHRHQSYISVLNEVSDNSLRSMSFYFRDIMLTNPGTSIWVWRDGRGVVQSAALISRRNSVPAIQVAKGKYLTALASAQRGAGPALLDCMVSALDDRDELPLLAPPAEQAVTWWEGQANRRNNPFLDPGGMWFDPNQSAWLIRSARELDAFVGQSWANPDDGPLFSRSVECVPGLYARYALARIPSGPRLGQYRVHISRPVKADALDEVQTASLAASLSSTGLVLVSEGWMSYGHWDDYEAITGVPSLRMTDTNYCDGGRPVEGAELVSDPNSVIGVEDRFTDVRRFVQDELARREAAFLPDIEQSLFEEFGERQILLGPNAPGECVESRYGVGSLYSMVEQTDGYSFWEYDCDQGIDYFLDPAAPASQYRGSYEVRVKDGRLVYVQDESLRPDFPGDFMDNYALYVVTADGRIFVGPGGQVNHSQLAGGAAVLAAGEMDIADGRILTVNNASGHYTPPCPSLATLASILSTGGVERESYDEVCIGG